MAEVFVISDTHFGHDNILKFTHDDEPLRPFETLTEMHVTIIDNWNKVVTPQDKVYHLGDVAFGGPANLKILGLLNGKKRLVRGNHDLLKISHYREFFHEIFGVKQINGFWLTHVPMHPMCVAQKRVKMNIHGHLHANQVMLPDLKDEPDPKYFNACVERINYTPVSIDEIA